MPKKIIITGTENMSNETLGKLTKFVYYPEHTIAYLLDVILLEKHAVFRPYKQTTLRLLSLSTKLINTPKNTITDKTIHTIKLHKQFAT